MPTLEQLNTVEEADATEHFRACCASTRWVNAMVAGRPFASLNEVLEAAERIWWALEPKDRLEALAAHPGIGDTAARGPMGEIARGWSAREQEGVTASDPAVRQELAAAVQEYERRFGWLYLVSATGRSARDLLGDVRSRLTNEPERERIIMARQQLDIMHLRLRKLLD